MASISTIIVSDVAPQKPIPVAVIAAEPENGVLGTVVRLDGRASHDSEDSTLSFTWSFVSSPIGSRVSQEGFRSLDSDGGYVSFSPDVTGDYMVSLKVSNGMYESEVIKQVISIRALLVPHARGIVPDGKFIWSYLRDVWTQVEGREMFETLWSALIQITGAELLKLYQVDFNKSIRDIQDLYQRRWLSYEPRLSLDQDTSFFLGNQLAGWDGSSVTTQQSAVVDTFAVAPPAGFKSISKGRLVTVGGQAFPILRVTGGVGGTLNISVENANIPPNQRSMSWRCPPTLISKTQDFEALGVAAGDILLVDVIEKTTNTPVELSLQVVGVSKNTLGVVYSKESTVPGVVPETDGDIFSALAAAFGIDGVSVTGGTASFAGVARDLKNILDSKPFQSKYGDVELTPEDEIDLAGLKIYIKPKAIIRNSFLPVDDAVMSIPALQEFVAQPTIVEHDGKVFQVKNGVEFELKNRPAVLVENSDYIVDGDLAFDGEMSFETGSDIILSEDGDFLDRGIKPGDSFSISYPVSIAGAYQVKRVLSKDKVQLTRAVPLHPLTRVVTATVKITRRRKGHFLRFVPGAFTPKSPAPQRLWAEVTFFDNAENIESNFGYLVGLKKNDLDSISSDVSYRQAVAGVMFALTQGSQVDKVRLGAHILLGLPFAEHRGIIRSIEGDYRLDAAGTPILGRILVEDLDGEKATGIFRVYTYPIDLISALAGVDTNPATGETYKVGDTVEVFASLCKGIEINDYMNSSAPLTGIRALQKFHRVEMRTNDNIFSTEELTLVSSFLKKITPSYIAFTIVNSSEYADQVKITDHVKLLTETSWTLADNPAMGLPFALMFDSRQRSQKMVFWDNRFLIKRTGYDLDLDAATNTATLSTIPNNFLGRYPDEDIEEPLIQEVLGILDMLYIHEGPNKGIYPISSIEVDGSLSIPGSFVSATGMKYSIVRQLCPELARLDVSFALGGTSMKSNGVSFKTLGVMPGDLAFLVGASWYKKGYVKAVSESVPETIFDTVSTTFSAPVAGTAELFIFRPALITSPFTWLNLSTQLPEVAEFEVVVNAGVVDQNQLLQAFMEFGDELSVVNDESKLRYTVVDPAGFVCSPPLPDGTYNVILLKKGRQPGVLTWNHLDANCPEDQVFVGLAGTSVSADSVSGDCSIDGADDQRYHLKVGDLFTFKTGNNAAVDVGYGLGVYRVTEVQEMYFKVLDGPVYNDVGVGWGSLRRL